MGTGSEPSQVPNLLGNAVGSVPVPVFHGPPVSPPKKGDRHRRQHDSVLRYLWSTEPVPVFGLPRSQFK